MLETGQILLTLALCLLSVILWQMRRILARLKRIEQLMPEIPSKHEASTEDAPPPETGAGSLFESFLSEEPSRRSLPKSEQFAAYRKWRNDKGLNWSAASD